MNNKIIISLLCAILIAVTVFSGITISSLDYRINELNGRVSYVIDSVTSSISNLESSLSGITTEIETTLHKQASIISDYSISYGKPDADTLTGEITINVIPKEYSEGTSAMLYLNNEGVTMARSGNAFTGTVAVKINGIYTPSVTFSDNAVNKSESLPEEIFYEPLLKQSLQVDYYLENYNNGADAYGTFSYSFHSELGDSAVSGKIVALNNNKEAWSKIISDPDSGEPQEYEYLMGKELSELNTYGNYEEYDVYVEVVGSLGFTYRYWLNGTDNISIYDRNGKEIVF